MVSFLSKLHYNETQFYQPNLSRSRQALRSPRNSENLNLEQSLFTYDVFKLYEKVALAETSLTDDFNIINNGSSLDYSITVSGDATPSNATIPSLESIATRLKGLSNRLEILEKGLH